MTNEELLAPASYEEEIAALEFHEENDSCYRITSNGTDLPFKVSSIDGGEPERENLIWWLDAYKTFKELIKESGYDTHNVNNVCLKHTKTRSFKVFYASETVSLTAENTLSERKQYISVTKI
ncbi:hypothetical protein [Thiomicrorhabdus xiamenensis]|uniref:Uncharacterized protein n=1 Tax=Thiomicrorhabdus xiamenensis TaxID=2739063 RepID=A0A7D4NQI3_9GAMM|nr:hypothetical protein [Thiomicrorhabdus xiamenensis]QKI89211.1 hypothetical protein HQN79_06360 [Thiomicrorhabdus xiamenensis]